MWIQLCHLNYRGFEADRGGWNKKGTGHREVLYPRFENKPDNKDSHIADGIFHSFPCPLVLCSSHHCEAQTGLDVQLLWCRRVPTCTRSDAAPLTTFAAEAEGARSSCAVWAALWDWRAPICFTLSGSWGLCTLLFLRATSALIEESQVFRKPSEVFH